MNSFPSYGRTVNWTDKSIQEFDSSNTLYISKTEHQKNQFYLCRFVSFSKGIVTAKVIEADGNKYPDHANGEIITARLKKCTLWGANPQDERNYFHWFKGYYAP